MAVGVVVCTGLAGCHTSRANYPSTGERIREGQDSPIQNMSHQTAETKLRSNCCEVSAETSVGTGVWC